MSQVTGNFTVNVKTSAPPPTPLTLTPADPAGTVGTGSTPATGALPDETEGVADAGDLVATVSGGTGPYTFSNITGVPPGMALNENLNADGSSSVVISGTPDAGDAATAPFTVGFTVTDSAGTTAQLKPARRIA